MSDPNFSANDFPPFSPDLVQNSDAAADVVGGHSLVRVLRALPKSDLSPEAVAATSSPEETRRALNALTFLSTLAGSIVAETVADVDFTRDNARKLGISAAAATVESVAQHQATYGHSLFMDDLGSRARRLYDTGAREYRAADRPHVWEKAGAMLNPEARARVVDVMMDELATHANELPLPEAARHAHNLLSRLDEAEGENAGSSQNPWALGIVETNEGHRALRQLEARSVFAQAVSTLLRDEVVPDQGLSANELYAEGVERLLAYVAVGVAKMSGRSA